MPNSISHFIYLISLAVYHAVIRLAAPFNKKAHDWIYGRKDLWNKIDQLPTFSGKTIWMHCASLGEFEQGRPLLEKIKREFPADRIVLTFFSPSGYNIRQNYAHANIVCYLPADSPKNASRFLAAIQPDLVVFIKYEFWYAFLTAIKQRNIPLFLASAVFRKEQPFFKWYGSLHRQMLRCYTSIFVQDNGSANLLQSIGIVADIAYDLRFDRVVDIAIEGKEVRMIASFSESNRLIIAGSTWPADEKMLHDAFSGGLFNAGYKLVIAPHEVNETHIRGIEDLFNKQCTRLSQAKENILAKVLIIDSIGLLSAIYRYAWVSYIGGGFGKGIHNTLEAAVYGRPVLFGPNHHKFKEAYGLKAVGGGFSIKTSNEFTQRLSNWNNDPYSYNSTCQAGRNYVYQHTGGTAIIFKRIAISLTAES